MPTRFLVIQVVSCETTEETRRSYQAADARADIVELRLDGIKDLDLDRLAAAPGKPKLLTVRSRQHGGGAAPADRERLLARAAATSAEYLDIEPGDEELPFLKGPGGPKRILSWHDMEATPFDLSAIHARLAAVPDVALIKIVTFADAATDNLRIRDLLQSEGRGRLIAFCMGPKGVPSRILASLWGSAAVYAPVRRGTPTAPGQVALEDLFELYRFASITGRTRLLGLVGTPIGHSLSPLMHNAALDALDLDYRYLPFEVATLAEALPLVTELRVAGLSVTVPYKEKILPYLDRVDPSARRTGAVNTVLKIWNRLEGHNTDVEGVLDPLRGRIGLKGARVAVMGAGGAARALLTALRRRGARVTIFSRTAARAAEVARRFGARSLPWHRLRHFPCDLLINATPVGLPPETGRTPLPRTWVAAPLVYDIIYNPPETTLLREARARGATVINGVEMFIAQGCAQFRLFTGRAAPAAVMRRAVLNALGPAPGNANGMPPAARNGGRRQGRKTRVRR